MIPNAVKLWVGWLLWVASLHAVALLVYYHSAPAAAARPVAHFAAPEQVVRTDASSGKVEVLLDVASPSPLAVEVPYTVTGEVGDLAPGLQSGRVVFPAGETAAALTFTVKNDPAFSGPRQVTLALGPTPDAQLGLPERHVLTFVAPETPVVQLDPEHVVPERVSRKQLIDIPVKLDRKAEKELTLGYSVLGAKAGESYKLLNDRKITIARGTDTGKIMLQVLDNPAVAEDETLAVALLSSPESVALGNPHEVKVVIAADEKPVVTVAADKTEVLEGPGAECIVTATVKPTVPYPIVLPYRAGGKALPGTDYEKLPGSLTIKAGELNASLTIKVMDNDELQDDRSLVLTFDPPAKARLAPPGKVDVKILDDDSRGDVLVLALLTQQFAKDWEANKKELERLFEKPYGDRLFGGGVYLINQDGKGKKWRPGDDYSPGSKDLFSDKVAMEDFFSPAMDHLNKLTQKARNKDFLTFVLWSSQKAPRANRRGPSGRLEVPGDREVYAYWLGGYWVGNNRADADWFDEFFRDTGRPAKGGSEKIQSIRLMRDPGKSFAEDLEGIVEARFGRSP